MMQYTALARGSRLVLEECCAYLIARTEKQTLALEKLVRRLGFQACTSLFSRHQFGTADHRFPANFFLVYRHVNPKIVSSVIKAIRRSPDANVRYAPVILFADECPFETYLNYIAMGFDDVLTLPDKKEGLVNRLERQLIGQHVYFETDTYLGPDRRRMELPTHTDSRRAGFPRGHARLTIRRSVDTGCAVIRTEVFA